MDPRFCMRSFFRGPVRGHCRRQLRSAPGRRRPRRVGVRSWRAVFSRSAPSHCTLCLAPSLVVFLLFCCFPACCPPGRSPLGVNPGACAGTRLGSIFALFFDVLLDLVFGWIWLHFGSIFGVIFDVFSLNLHHVFEHGFGIVFSLILDYFRDSPNLKKYAFIIVKACFSRNHVTNKSNI